MTSSLNAPNHFLPQYRQAVFRGLVVTVGDGSFGKTLPQVSLENFELPDTNAMRVAGQTILARLESHTYRKWNAHMKPCSSGERHSTHPWLIQHCPACRSLTADPAGVESSMKSPKVNQAGSAQLEEALLGIMD
jgi:hypothetical protein